MYRGRPSELTRLTHTGSRGQGRGVGCIQSYTDIQRVQGGRVYTVIQIYIGYRGRPSELTRLIYTESRGQGRGVGYIQLYRYTECIGGDLVN